MNPTDLSRTEASPTRQRPTQESPSPARSTRILGRSGLDVSALGMGCWAIGGPWRFQDTEGGWGPADDAESVRAVRTALDAGVTFFDTAATYGAGHSERVLGEALRGRRDEVRLATKFGHHVDEEAVRVTDVEVEPEQVRASCFASLRRLGTDRIDLFQLHVGDLPLHQALEVREALDDLVADGRIRAYGWSTDDVDAASAFAAGAPHCVAVQHTLNVFQDAPAMLRLCEAEGLASIDRTPLGMGVLSGRYAAGDRVRRDDVRAQGQTWLEAFDDLGRPSPSWLRRLEAVRDVLTSDGRTVAQGALAWIWGRSPVTIPIPGVRTVAQARDNAGALAHGPLTADHMAEIQQLLAGQEP